jgi:uncharacterized protein
MQEFDNGLNKKFEFDFSKQKDFDIDELKIFLKKDKEAVLIFYGGEPLLEIEKVKKIIDNINVPFRMQTNGILLDKLSLEYLNKIDKILISLDGDKERTDFNRGKGTYEKVISNIKKIKTQGYNGELIARMCISFPDIFKQVKHLIEAGFDSVHWQIDAGFYKYDFNEKEFEKFTEEYNIQIKKLIDYWVKDMESGNVLKLYPFIGIINDILNNQQTKLRCGAGHSGYAITTDGKIVACPIMNCIKDFEAGTLKNNPLELKKFSIQNECLNCTHLNLCGGRCLYANMAKLWSDKARKMICKTVKFYINYLKEQTPHIQKLISEKKIKIEDFDYEKYFGPEIIP